MMIMLAGEVNEVPKSLGNKYTYAQKMTAIITDLNQHNYEAMMHISKTSFVLFSPKIKLKAYLNTARYKTQKRRSKLQGHTLNTYKSYLLVPYLVLVLYLQQQNDKHICEIKKKMERIYRCIYPAVRTLSLLGQDLIP